MAIPSIGGPVLPITSVPGPLPTGGPTGDPGGGVLGFLKNNWQTIAQILGGAATAYASYEAFKEGQKNSANSDALMHEGIDMAKQDYAGRGQYRDAAQQHLLNPQRPNLGGLFADAGDPYKRQSRVPSVGGGLPPAIPQAPQGPAPGAPPMPPGGPSGARPISPITQPPYQSPKAQSIAAEIANARGGAAPPAYNPLAGRVPVVGRM